jgi:hypothetical protein
MKMSKLKLAGMFSLFVIAITAISACVSALEVADFSVELNGDEVTNATLQDIDRGESLDVKVRFTAVGNASNIELHADMFGYEYGDRVILHDSTDVFDVEDGVSYTKKLSIELPQRMDRQDWTLVLFLADRNGEMQTWNYNLNVGTERHQLTLKDVSFSPESSVQAGRSLIAVARVKNSGEKTEEGIKVRLSIPELGVSATDYIDELESEESTTTEELYTVIPECAKAGSYDAIVELLFSDGEKITSVEKTVVVTEGSACEIEQKVEEKTILTVGPESQTVKAGEKIVYPITISNAGSAAKQYTISAEAGEWADITVSPSNVVVLEAGEAKAVYVYATADKDAEGSQLIAVKIASADKTLKEITLKADVVGVSGWEKAKKALEVGLVILVILLVIIGLIIGFNRLKGNEDEENKEETQTYY